MKFRQLFNQKTWEPDWDKIWSIKEFKAMKKCMQSTVWHKEGACSTHTRLVTGEMYYYLKRLGIKPSSDRYYIMMMSAAICHDLGKPTTTKFDSEKGDYTTKCHGAEGANITRRLFFEEDLELREDVCYMVRHHMTLHHVFDKEETVKRKFIQLSHGRVRVEDMMILNACDSLGSINLMETPSDVDEKFKKMRDIAFELGCFTSPYKFESDYQKLMFFHDKEMLLPGDCPKPSAEGKDFTMYVMIGVPGAGKSYYVENELSKYECISRDLIRSEIGIKGVKPQGNKKEEDKVTEIFNKRIVDCCEKRKSFVLDNTNVRKMYRDEYTDMVLKYNPRIVYIYIEASTLEEYKDRRRKLMPLSVIDKMWGYFDFPEYSECTELRIVKQGKKNWFKKLIDFIWKRK